MLMAAADKDAIRRPDDPLRKARADARRRALDVGIYRWMVPGHAGVLPGRFPAICGSNDWLVIASLARVCVGVVARAYVLLECHNKEPR